jgi:hypothetical protein
MVPGAIIRLFYTYPTVAGTKASGGKDYSSQNFGSAYSTNGYTFTIEAGARFSGSYLTDPDVFKEGTNKWVMFYSKAVSTEALDRSRLFKATCATPAGTYVVDSGFTGGELGNISSTLKIGSSIYVYLVSSEGLTIASYNPSSNKLTYIKLAVSGAVDPSVIQLTTTSFKMFYKQSGNTYSADSTDGMTWTNSKQVVAKAEVPGAVYYNNIIYLYYTDADPASPYQGQMVLRTSSDNGVTFSSPQPTTGTASAACDPDPVIYE